MTSVARLVKIWKFLETKHLPKVAQKCGDFWDIKE